MSINVTGYRAGVQSIKYTLDSLSPIQTGIMLAPLPAVLNVGGMLTLSVAASDNVGVVGVQVKLDGANLGPELAVPPYLVRWNSASVPDGPHNFTATARDAAGNSTTTPPLNTTVGNADPIALIPVDISKLADGLHVACVSWINREGRLDWADPILFRVNQTTGFSNGVRQLVITP
ncbi:MAG: Ig-like domain-containing protein [Nitrospiraceae bacterium]